MTDNPSPASPSPEPPNRDQPCPDCGALTYTGLSDKKRHNLDGKFHRCENAAGSKCKDCGAAYQQDWAGTTCIECDGDIVASPAQAPPEPQSATAEFEAKCRARIVTPERARLAAHRLVNSHFNNPEPHARMSIPVNLDDDDIVIHDFISQVERAEGNPVAQGPDEPPDGDAKDVAATAYQILGALLEFLPVAPIRLLDYFSAIAQGETADNPLPFSPDECRAVAHGQPAKPQPTYYERHPDDTYSVADLELL